MNSKVGPLFSLLRIGNSIHQLNKRSEEKIGLSLVQWCLLEQLVDMPGTSSQALAQSVGVHPSTLTQTLKRLGKKGFVFQAEDPRDSRKKVISMTKDGKKALDKINWQMRTWAKSMSSFEKDLDRVSFCLHEEVSTDKARSKIK